MFNGGKIIKARVLYTQEPKDRMNDDTIARVEPLLAPSVVSYKVTIPWILRGSTGNLKENDIVAVCIFDDKSGIIIDRMDGEWTGKFRGSVTVEEGSLTVDEELRTTGAATFAATVDAKGKITSETDVSAPKCVSLNNHTHTGNAGAPTSPPNT